MSNGAYSSGASYGLALHTGFSKLTSTGACIIKPFMDVIYSFRNKLECLSLGGFSSLV
jgi:hypothetical protein